ncbi:MAG: RNA polymerase sigma factor [Janthinobacterium lividum]
MDDDALMRRVADGDAQAFGLIVQAYQNRLVRFAVRLLGDSDAAQDAAQEAFLRLWRLRASYQPRGCLQAYLLRTVRSVCLDRIRAKQSWEALDEGLRGTASDPASLAEGNELADAVRRAVQSLPEPQRVVFILSQYEELSYAEIADVLDCPLGTVASRKHQATETLRRKLYPWRDPT